MEKTYDPGINWFCDEEKLNNARVSPGGSPRSLDHEVVEFVYNDVKQGGPQMEGKGKSKPSRQRKQLKCDGDPDYTEDDCDPLPDRLFTGDRFEGTYGMRFCYHCAMKAKTSPIDGSKPRVPDMSASVKEIPFGRP